VEKMDISENVAENLYLNKINISESKTAKHFCRKKKTHTPV